MTTRRLLAVLPVIAASVLLLVWARGCKHAEPLPPIDGDGDADGDADGDGDGDGDGDADADADDADADALDADVDIDYPLDVCASAGDCVLALNYRQCCPMRCPLAWLRGAVRRDYCFVEAAEAEETPPPLGCTDVCEGGPCDDCPPPSGVACVDGRCATTYPGDECQTSADCDDGEVCERELVVAESRCVPDPNECYEDADCEDEEGYECRDWLTEDRLFCWHPDSICVRDDQCDYNNFCEDPEGDGVFECVDRAPLCRVCCASGDCPAGQDCVDDDGDGRGDCRD
jgi:hypothetical protein